MDNNAAGSGLEHPGNLQRLRHEATVDQAELRTFACGAGGRCRGNAAALSSAALFCKKSSAARACDSEDETAGA